MIALSVKGKKLAFYANVILALIIIVVSTLFLLRLIGDPDFFWHLKSGEGIWQNKSLPSSDLFSLTSPQEMSMRSRFILTSYWLSQIIYHLIHSAAGFQGIIFLRFLLFGALLYSLIRRRQADLTLYLGLLLLFVVTFLQIFPIDRPQVFSFLLFSILLLLLDKIKQGDSAGKYGIPLLMLLWGNVHGGYMMGQAILLTYIVMEGIKFLRPDLLNPVQPKAYRRLVMSGVAGIACSFINPNTYRALEEMLKVPAFMTSYSNLEYLSSIELFLRNNDPSMLLYWFMLFLAVFGVLASIKRIDLTDLVLLSATAYFSFTQIRYIAFFLIAAVPIAGKLLSRDMILSWTRPFIVVAALLIGIIFSRGEIGNTYFLKSGNWINSYMFPVEAADFIVKNDIKGNMYNHMTWGGYLIWRLGPERKVFTDGRNLYESNYAQSVFVDTANSRMFIGLPYWKSILTTYDINYIVTPFYHSQTGVMMPLVKALSRDDDWVPVFINMVSLVFVKNTPQNEQVIAKARRSVKKEYLEESMLYMCNLLIKRNTIQARHHLTKGDIYVHMSRFKEAREEYLRVLEKAPLNRTAKERINELDRYGK